MIEQETRPKSNTADANTLGSRINDRMARSTFSSKMHRRFYRISAGRIGGEVKGVGVLLLTTEGRRSHTERTVPLTYLQKRNQFLVVASNAVSPDRPPAWWLNLQAKPEARVQMRSTSHRVRARDLDCSEREAVWPELTRHNPNWERFQQETIRRFPVVSLQLEADDPQPT